MKKIFGYILAAAALTPALTSCSDYLEVTDESSVSPDNFPTNMTHVDLLLNSAYAGSHQLGLYGYMWFPKFMYLMDHNLDCFGNYDDRSDFLINNVSTDNYYNTETYGNKTSATSCSGSSSPIQRSTHARNMSPWPPRTSCRSSAT